MLLLALVIALQVPLYFVALAWGLDRRGQRALDASAKFDAVVVLGARVHADGTASATLIRRAHAGADAVKRGLAPRLILSGGKVGSDVSEARAALPHALSRGIPEDSVALEETSTTTETNATEVARMLDANARVLVVTDAFHIVRSVRLFRAHFQHVEGLGTVGGWQSRVRGSLREAFVLVAYLAQGKLDRTR
jgi:uncharacterized SAM-binding protein YcdF (DUF218 family)